MTGCTPHKSLAGHKTYRDVWVTEGRWEHSQRGTATMAPRRQVASGMKKDRDRAVPSYGP